MVVQDVLFLVQMVVVTTTVGNHISKYYTVYVFNTIRKGLNGPFFISIG